MWEKFKEWWQAFVDFLYDLLLTAMTLTSDMALWIFEQLMKGAIALSDTLGDGLEALNPATYISAIPEDTKAMMAMSGFNESMSILVVALGIRIVIQLIPFIRWGS